MINIYYAINVNIYNQFLLLDIVGMDAYSWDGFAISVANKVSNSFILISMLIVCKLQICFQILNLKNNFRELVLWHQSEKV